MSTLRARAVDKYKPLPILLDPHDDDGTFVSRPVKELPTGMEREEEQETHFRRLMNELSQTKEFAAHRSRDIPTRNVIRLEKSSVEGGWKIPTNYVSKHKTEFSDQEYDATEEDADFLSTLSPSISVDLFEKVITKIENIAYEIRSAKAPIARPLPESVIVNDSEILPPKAEYKSDQEVAIESIAPFFPSESKNILESILEYWKEQKSKIGKPCLLFRLLPQQLASNQNPYVAFRPRTSETYSLSQTQRRTPLVTSERRSHAQSSSHTNSSSHISQKSLLDEDDDDDVFEPPSSFHYHSTHSSSHSHIPLQRHSVHAAQNVSVTETAPSISKEEVEQVRRFIGVLKGARMLSLLSLKRERVKRKRNKNLLKLTRALIDQREYLSAGSLIKLRPTISKLDEETTDANDPTDGISYALFARSMRKEIMRIASEIENRPTHPSTAIISSDIVKEMREKQPINPRKRSLMDISMKGESESDEELIEEKDLRALVQLSSQRLLKKYKDMSLNDTQPIVYDPSPEDVALNPEIIAQMNENNLQIISLPISTPYFAFLRKQELEKNNSETEMDTEPPKLRDDEYKHSQIKDSFLAFKSANKEMIKQRKNEIETLKQLDEEQKRKNSKNFFDRYPFSYANVPHTFVEGNPDTAFHKENPDLIPNIHFTRETFLARPRIDRSGRNVFDIIDIREVENDSHDESEEFPLTSDSD